MTKNSKPRYVIGYVLLIGLFVFLSACVQLGLEQPDIHTKPGGLINVKTRYFDLNFDPLRGMRPVNGTINIKGKTVAITEPFIADHLLDYSVPTDRYTFQPIAYYGFKDVNYTLTTRKDEAIINFVGTIDVKTNNTWDLQFNGLVINKTFRFTAYSPTIYINETISNPTDKPVRLSFTHLISPLFSGSTKGQFTIPSIGQTLKFNEVGPTYFDREGREILNGFETHSFFEYNGWIAYSDQKFNVTETYLLDKTKFRFFFFDGTKLATLIHINYWPIIIQPEQSIEYPIVFSLQDGNTERIDGTGYNGTLMAGLAFQSEQGFTNEVPTVSIAKQNFILNIFNNKLSQRKLNVSILLFDRVRDTQTEIRKFTLELGELENKSFDFQIITTTDPTEGRYLREGDYSVIANIEDESDRTTVDRTFKVGTNELSWGPPKNISIMLLAHGHIPISLESQISRDTPTYINVLDIAKNLGIQINLQITGVLLDRLNNSDLMCFIGFSLENNKIDLLGSGYSWAILPITNNELGRGEVERQLDLDILSKKENFEGKNCAPKNFSINGLMPPELAWEDNLFDLAIDKGYKFVILDDSQIAIEKDPHKIYTYKKDNETIFIFFRDSRVSQVLWKDFYGYSTPIILKYMYKNLPNNSIIVIATDIEQGPWADSTKFSKLLSTIKSIPNTSFVLFKDYTSQVNQTQDNVTQIETIIPGSWQNSYRYWIGSDKDRAQWTETKRLYSNFTLNNFNTTKELLNNSEYRFLLCLVDGGHFWYSSTFDRFVEKHGNVTDNSPTKN